MSLTAKKLHDMKTRTNTAILLEWLFWTVAALFFSLFLISCSTTKRHSTFAAWSFKDSSRASASVEVKTDDYRAHHITTKDTSVVFPRRFAQFVFSPQQLQPLYTAAGKPQAQSHSIDSNGIKAIVTAMLDGSLLVTCEADSLKIVIAAVTRINDSLIKNSSHSAHSSESSSTSERMTYSEVWTKTKSLFSNWWKWIVGILVVLFLIEYLIKKITPLK